MNTNTATLWVARDKESNNILISDVRPQFGKYSIFTDDEAWYVSGESESALFEESSLFPGLTFEKSPLKVKLIIES